MSGGGVMKKLKTALSMAWLMLRVCSAIAWESWVLTPVRAFYHAVPRKLLAAAGVVDRLVLPIAITDIDSAWLTACLRASGHLGSDAVVTELRAKCISGPDLTKNGGGVGGGLTCNSYRLTFDVARVQPQSHAAAAAAAAAADAADAAKVPAFRSVVVKLTNPAFGGRFTNVLANLKHEVSFYTTFAPVVQPYMYTPTAYYARANRFTGDYALVLEDLAPLTIYGQGRECSEPQLQLIVTSLARMHARFLGLTATDPALRALSGRKSDGTLDTASRWSDRTSEGLFADTRNKGWAAMQALDSNKFAFAAKWQSGPIRALGDAMFGGRGALSKAWDAYVESDATLCYHTLTHNDFHPMNILLRPATDAAAAAGASGAAGAAEAKAPEAKGAAAAAAGAAAAGAAASGGREMAVLDWQVYRTGLGVQELSQFLCNVTVARRHRIEAETFALYRDTLKRSAVEQCGDNEQLKRAAQARVAAVDDKVLHLQYRCGGATRMFGMVMFMLQAMNPTANEVTAKNFQWFSDLVYQHMIDNKADEAIAALVSGGGAAADAKKQS